MGAEPFLARLQHHVVLPTEEVRLLEPRRRESVRPDEFVEPHRRRGGDAGLESGVRRLEEHRPVPLTVEQLRQAAAQQAELQRERLYLVRRLDAAQDGAQRLRRVRDDRVRAVTYEAAS